MDFKHSILPWLPSIVGFPARPKPTMAKSPCFEGFGKLPIDLRRKIWFHSLPAPQSIQLSLQVRETLDHGQRIFEWTHDPCPLTTLNPPPLLFVNHEARDIVLEHYHKLPFRATPNTHYFQSTNARCVYFNYATDTFVIRYDHLQYLFQSADENYYMLDAQFTRLFPNLPMNVKRFSTCEAMLIHHLKMRGDPPEFPHTEKAQRIQNWLYIGAKVQRVKDNYARGLAVWKSPLPLYFKGLCHTGIDKNDEVFLQLTNSIQQTPTFHPFQTLPFELRRQIWKYLLPPPAHLYLSLHPAKNSDLMHALRTAFSKPKALLPQDLIVWPDPHFDPTLLLVNRETHSLFLEFYTWIPLQSAHVPGSNPTKAGVYFDPASDCFLLWRRHMSYDDTYLLGLEDRFTGLPLSVMKLKVDDFVRACVMGGYRVFAAVEGQRKGKNLLEGVFEREGQGEFRLEGDMFKYQRHGF